MDEGQPLRYTGERLARIAEKTYEWRRDPDGRWRLFGPVTRP